MEIPAGTAASPCMLAHLFGGGGWLDPAADVKETIGGKLLTGMSYDSRAPDRCEMPFEVAAWDRVSVPPCHLSSSAIWYPQDTFS